MCQTSILILNQYLKKHKQMSRYITLVTGKNLSVFKNLILPIMLLNLYNATENSNKISRF